jgi:hypothetical protein
LRSELCERLETTPDQNAGTVTDRGWLRALAEKSGVAELRSLAADADLWFACGE